MINVMKFSFGEGSENKMLEMKRILYTLANA